MRLQAAFFCDAATVRENLLHVLGAGLTLFRRPTFPAPLGAEFAAIFVLDDPKDWPGEFDATVSVRDPDDAVIFEGRITWSTPDLPTFGTSAAAPVGIPMALSLRDLRLDGPGIHKLSIKWEDQEAVTSFLVDVLHVEE